jgi:hypothetical protein
MKRKFKAGDRVHYRVYPSGTPDETVGGTVLRVERGIYFVLWDDVAPGYEPTGYESSDIAAVEKS